MDTESKIDAQLFVLEDNLQLIMQVGVCFCWLWFLTSVEIIIVCFNGEPIVCCECLTVVVLDTFVLS